MAGKECTDCLVADLRKLHRLMERKAAQKIPEEVREPLMEAKRQMRLAVKGFIRHLLTNEEAGEKKNSGISRSISLE